MRSVLYSIYQEDLGCFAFGYFFFLLPVALHGVDQGCECGRDSDLVVGSSVAACWFPHFFHQQQWIDIDVWANDIFSGDVSGVVLQSTQSPDCPHFVCS